MPHPALPTQLLPTGRGVDNQLVTNSPPCGEGLGVGQKQYYATYVSYMTIFFQKIPLGKILRGIFMFFEKTQSYEPYLSKLLFTFAKTLLFNFFDRY
jgi:hypothetical protein